MTKQQFKNLSRSFRAMRRMCTVGETLAWIAHFSVSDARLMQRIYCGG